MSIQIISKGQTTDLRAAAQQLKALATGTQEWQDAVDKAKGRISQNLSDIAAKLYALEDDAKGAAKGSEAFRKSLDTKVLNDYLNHLITLGTAYQTVKNQEERYVQQIQLTQQGVRDGLLLGKTQLQGEENLRTSRQKQLNQIALLVQAYSRVHGAESERIAILKEMLRQANASHVADLKRVHASDQLNTKLTNLNTTEGRADSQNRARISTQEKLNAILVQREGALKLAQRANQKDIVQLDRQIAQEKAVYAARMESTKAIIQQETASRRLARERAQLADPKYIAFLQGQVEAKAAKAAAVEETNRAVTIRRLQRELAYVTSAEGKLEVALRQQIAAQRLSIEESRKQTASFKIMTQATAGLRAGLAGLKTSFGMYTSATIMTASAVYAFTASLRQGFQAGKDYTFQMSQTMAVMNAMGTDTSFAKLEQEVVRLGKSTQFTMTEVARASTELGKIGLRAEEATKALKPVLSLSLLGDMDLADAAKTATDVMLLFKKEASDLGNVVDIMATAVTNSSATIGQLTNALSYAGASAEAAGFKLEEVVAAEMALANAGIRGSIAGTALRRAFTNLLNPTAKGAKVMEEFNLITTDAFGNTRDLTEIFGELATALNGLPEEEKIQKLSDLFGVRAASPMAALLGNVKNFHDAVEMLNDAEGNADLMMKRRTDNLQTDMKLVASSLEALYVQVFQNSETQLRIWALKAKALIDHLSEDIGGGITRIEAWAASAAQSIKYLVAGLLVMKGAKVIASFIQPMYAAHKFQSAINQVTTAQGALQASLIQTNTLLQTQNTLMAGGGVRRGTQTAAFGAAPVGATTASATSRAAGVAGVAGAKAGLGALSMAALTPTGIGQVVGAAAMVGMIGLTAYEAYKAYRSIKGATEKDMDGLRRKQKEILDAMRPDEEAEAKKASAKARIGAHVQTSGDLEYLEKKRENVRKEIAQVQALMKDASGAQMEMLTNVYDGLLEQEKKLYNQISTMSLQFKKDADLTMATSKASIEMVQDDFLAALSSSYEGPRGAAEYLIETNEVINAQITQLRLKYAEATEGIAADQENLARMEKKAGEIRSKWFKSTYDKKELAQLERLISNVEKSLSSAQAKRAEEKKLGSETLSFTAAKVLAEEGVSVEELTKTWDELQAKMKSVREEGLDEETAKARANAMGAIEKYRHGLSLLYAEESKYKAAQEKLLELSVQGTQLRIDGANSEEKQRKLSGEMAVHMKKINALLKDNIPLRAEVRKIGIDSAKALAKDQEKLRLVEEEALKRLYAMKIAYQDKGISALNYVQAQKAELDALQELRDSQDKNLQAMKGINELYHSAPAGLNAYAQAMDNVSRAEAAGLVSAKQAAAYRQQSLNDMVAAANLPTAKGSLPNNFLSSTFNPLLSHVEGMGAYARDMAMSPLAEKAEQDELQRAYDLNKEKYEIIRLSNQDNLELQKYANEQEIAAKEKFESDKLSLEQSYADRSKAVAQQQRDYQVQSMMLIAAGMADTAAYVAGAMAGSFEDGSRSQKAAFAVQKALAISSIMLNAYVAAQAAKTAMLSTAYMNGPAGLISAETAYWLVLGQGIATASMVGGMALAEITSSGKSGGKVGSRSAGMFDSGGTISRGKWGIVGEYGPEIVNGPARVTSRKNTAHQLGSGATIAPVINVNYTSSGDSETSQKDAAIMAEMVKSIVVKTLNDEMRSNGMMSR